MSIWRVGVWMAAAGVLACGSEPEKAPPGSADTGATGATGALRLTARMVDGTPIAGAAVSVPGRSSITDDIGLAAIEGLAPGEVTVTVSRPGGLDTHQRFTVTAGESVVADVYLTPVASAEVSAAAVAPVVLAGLEVTAAGFVTEDGAPYTGAVDLRAAPVDESNQLAAPPADTSGALPLFSFALAAYAAGTETLVQPDEPIVVRLKLDLPSEVVAALADGTGTLSARRFDPGAGWVDSGTATWASGVLEASLPHLTSWSFGANGVTYSGGVGCTHFCARVQVTSSGVAVSQNVAFNAPSRYIGTSFSPAFSIALTGSSAGTACGVTTGWTPCQPESITLTAAGSSMEVTPVPDIAEKPKKGLACGNPATCVDLGTFELGVTTPACVLTPALCEDKNPCTTDTCDPGSGCKHVVVTGGCDDGSSCTAGETCTVGATTPANPTGAICKAVTTTTCPDDDGFACTGSSCDAFTGQCRLKDDCPPGCAKGDVGVAQGTANLPKLTAVPAGAKTFVQDQFSGAALDAKRWIAAPAEPGTSITIADDVLKLGYIPSPSVTSARLDLRAGPVDANGKEATFDVEFGATLDFVLGAAAKNCQIRMGVEDLDTGKSLEAVADVQMNAGTLVISGASNAAPVPVDKSTGRLSFEFNPVTGRVAADLGGLWGSIGELEDQSFETGPYKLHVSALCEVADPTKPGELLALEFLDTNLSFTTSAYWTLSGSALTLDGQDFTWYGLGGQPLFDFVPSAGELKSFSTSGGPVEFEGTEPVVNVALAKMKGLAVYRTIFTPLTRVEFDAFLKTDPKGSLELVAFFPAFTRQVDGTYEFALPAKCP